MSSYLRLCRLAKILTLCAALAYALFGAFACARTTHPSSRPIAPMREDGIEPIGGIGGTVTYADNTPATDANIAITDLKSAALVAVVSADRNGRFVAPVAVGDYAIAIAAGHGALWVEKLHLSEI